MNSSEIRNPEKNSVVIKKNLLSASVIKKNYRVDTEQILHDHLYPKFGQRYLDYREKYENMPYLHNFWFISYK